jgi:hypothetical protein
MRTVREEGRVVLNSCDHCGGILQNTDSPVPVCMPCEAICHKRCINSHYQTAKHKENILLRKLAS